MKTFKLEVTMEYVTEVKIKANTEEEARQEAKDMAGDGLLLKDAQIVNIDIQKSY